MLLLLISPTFSLRVSVRRSLHLTINEKNVRCTLSFSLRDFQVYFYRLSDIQWLLLEDARDKLLRRGVDVSEYSFAFREGYATQRSSS